MGGKHDVAAMGAGKLARDGQAKAGAAPAGRAGEGLEEMFARLRRQAGAVITDADGHDGALAPGGDLDTARFHASFLAGDGLTGIACEIGQNAGELFRIGIGGQPFRHGVDQFHHTRIRFRQVLEELGNERPQKHRLAPGRAFLRLAVFQGVNTEVDGPIQGRDQLGGEALNGGIVHHGEAVGDHLRLRQHVAQLVTDLRHGQPQSGQPRLLTQKRGRLSLHVGQVTFRLAQLIAAVGGIEHRSGIFGIPGKAGHAAGHAADGADQEPVNGEIEQRCHHQGEGERIIENGQRMADHGLKQRAFVHGQLDELGLDVGRSVHDGDDAVAAMQEGDEGIADRPGPGQAAQIIAGLGHERQAVMQNETTGAAAANGNNADTGALQQFLAQAIGDLHVRRRLHGERGDFRHGQPVLQPCDAEFGDGGHENEGHADEDEKNGERQDTGRKRTAPAHG